MENNWPEAVDELLEECQLLISRYDLYTLGERGEPLLGEAEPRVVGTDYLAGEYQYGVAMIPAQWVTHVIDAATLCGGKLTAEQVEKAIRKYAHDDSCYIFEVYGEMCRFIADELNAMLGGVECELVEVDSYRSDMEIIHVLECSACGKTCEHVNGSYPKCPHCGARAVKR